MTWKAPFTINSHTPPSSSSPTPDLETDSPLSLPDCLALAGPIRNPQDLASNEPPGSSRPLHKDWGQSYSFSASFPPTAKSPPALFCLSVIIFGPPYFGGRQSQEFPFVSLIIIAPFMAYVKTTPNSQLCFCVFLSFLLHAIMHFDLS